MSALRTSALRHTLRKPTRLAQCQRRWAQVHDVRFLATIPRSEKVFEKYKDKLDRKAKEIGVTSVDELKKIYKPPKSAFPSPPPPPGAAAAAAAAAAAGSSTQPPDQSAPVQQTSSSSTRPPPVPPSFGRSPVKTLSSYLDVQKVLTLPAKEISTLWRLRHASDPHSLCATIPTEVYRKIESTARRHPQFILPIAREVKPEQLPEGSVSVGANGAAAPTAAEIHFLQWTFPAPDTVTVLFTHLAEYKLRGEYATPHTTVTHHLELAEEKGLVMLQGQVMEGKGVSVDDGRWLLMCLQKFYGMEEREERRRLLRQFSEGDQGFKVEELVSEAERIL